MACVFEVENDLTIFDVKKAEMIFGLKNACRMTLFRLTVKTTVRTNYYIRRVGKQYLKTYTLFTILPL